MLRRPPTNHVGDLLPRTRELEAHVLDGRGPEPVGIVLRADDEIAVVRDPVTAHQAHDVRALEHLWRRPPDDLCHGAKPSARDVDTFS